MTGGEFVVVLVTTATADEAAHIAQTLVEERLAACVNVLGPIRSLFRWAGNIDDATVRAELGSGRLWCAMDDVHPWGLSTHPGPAARLAASRRVEAPSLCLADSM